jgi:hypothetical protein
MGEPMNNIRMQHDKIEQHNKMYYSKTANGWVEFAPVILYQIEKLLNKSGIYRLYDGNKRMVYVGKSYDLGNRILNSAKERKASYYSYSLVDNKADADLYEIYYISTEKPLLNKQSNNIDIPSLKFPSLEFSKLYDLYGV